MEKEFDNGKPLYDQVRDKLYKQISSGIYNPGEQLPSEECLGGIFKVSRVTIRAAIQLLVDEKILVKKRGKGTFVANHVFFESVTAQGSFTSSCKQMNVVPSTKVIYAGRKKVDTHILNMLQIEEDIEVICIKRVRMTDGVPVIFEIDYFSNEFEYMLESDLGTIPIRKIIEEKSGLLVERYIDTFDVSFADREQAKWLVCPVKTALLGVNQVVFGNCLKPLYYNEQYIRSDLYKYVTEQ